MDFVFNFGVELPVPISKLFLDMYSCLRLARFNQQFKISCVDAYMQKQECVYNCSAQNYLKNVCADLDGVNFLSEFLDLIY